MSVRATAAVTPATGAAFALTEVTVVDPRPDEIVVRIVASGICHTDILARDGIRPPRPPAVFGHEGAGIVEEVGRSVGGLVPGDKLVPGDRLVPGDKVVLSFASCGQCSACTAGNPAHCPAFPEHNYAGARPDGSPTLRTREGEVLAGSFFGQSSFATHALVRARQAVRVPEDSDLGLLCPLGCAVQTGVGTVLNTLRPAPAEPVVVIGAGAVGLSAVMGTIIAGCRPIVVDVVPARLRLAAQLGAEQVIDGGHGSISDQITAAVGSGAKSIVDTTGDARVLPDAVRALAVGGSYAVVGAVAAGTTVPVDLQHLGRGRRLLGVVEGDSNPAEFIPRLVDFWRSGRLPLDRIVREYPMAEIDRAVSDMLAGDVVKPVIRFGPP